MLDPPGRLYYGQRFKTFGVSNGRYQAQWRSSITDVRYNGWVTGDSAYVERIADGQCDW